MRRSKRFLSWALVLSAALAFGSVPGAAGVEDLRVTVGKSVVIDFPSDVARISTSNPEVVDAVAVSTREVLLHARSYGLATVVIWSREGQRNIYNITVDYHLEPFRKLLAETFPREEIHVQAAKDSVTLTGRVSSPQVSERAAALAASVAKTVVNNLETAPSAVEKQILLRVKIAELNRTASASFGVNLLSTGALNTPGRTSTGQFAPPSPGDLLGGIPGSLEGTTSRFNISDALNVFAFRPDLNLAALIRALQDEGVLQILAEPNLVASNGKEASFLVGGEFPVPVIQGGANVGAVTIQFREFGIRLAFLPNLTDNGTVKMFVRPEVSTVDIVNAVTVNGFSIPALATRRMETTIELGEGQSFVIAGLLDDRVRESMSRIPGLSHIPLLGLLFKSRQEQKSKTELLVMVTPEIVTPLTPGEKPPLPVMPKEFLKPYRIPAPPAPEGAPAGQGAGQPSRDALGSGH